MVSLEALDLAYINASSQGPNKLAFKFLTKLFPDVEHINKEFSTLCKSIVFLSGN